MNIPLLLKDKAVDDQYFPEGQHVPWQQQNQQCIDPQSDLAHSSEP